MSGAMPGAVLLQNDTLAEMSMEEDLLSADAEVISLHRKDISEEDDDGSDSVSDTEPVSYVGDVDSDEQDDVFLQRPDKRWIYSRPCAVCIYLCLALMLLASIVSLIVVGVLIGIPYHRVAHFIPTQCVIYKVSMDDEHRRCSCGKGCNSLYPCLSVTVEYVDIHNTDHESIMYENESTINRKCSYYPVCKSSHLANQESVQDYREMLGSKGNVSTCYYNPSNPREVIRTKRFHKDHLVHALVWPCVILLCAFLILALIIKKRGCDFL